MRFISKRSRFGLGVWIFALFMAAFEGCGSPIAADSGSSTNNNQQTPGDGGSRAGQAGFGIQCPYAYVQDPTAVAVDLSECPGANIQLTQPLESIMFSADCLNKNIVARTSDKTVDDTFEAKPDGTFYFEMAAGNAVLSNGCTIPLVADVSGIMSCGSLSNQNYDQVNISVDASWSQAPAAAGVVATTACQLPPGCMLHAAATIQQCKPSN